MRGRRRRALTPEERELWSKVAESAEPLHPSAPAADQASAPLPVVGQPPPPAPRPKTRRTEPAVAPQKPAAPKAPALAHIDRRTRARISRGTIPIDGRIDLHGYTQQGAHDRLLGFLRSIQAQDGRVVLVITGKAREDGPDGRGVLRRAVPHWLGSAAYRPFVVGFEEAHRGHGGSGALYVRVRRIRRHEPGQ